MTGHLCTFMNFILAKVPLPGKYLLLLDLVNGNLFVSLVRLVVVVVVGAAIYGYTMRYTTISPSSPSKAALTLDSSIDNAVNQANVRHPNKFEFNETVKCFLMPFKLFEYVLLVDAPEHHIPIHELRHSKGLIAIKCERMKLTVSVDFVSHTQHTTHDKRTQSGIYAPNSHIKCKCLACVSRVWSD